MIPANFCGSTSTAARTVNTNGDLSSSEDFNEDGSEYSPSEGDLSSNILSSETSDGDTFSSLLQTFTQLAGIPV